MSSSRATQRPLRLQTDRSGRRSTVPVQNRPFALGRSWSSGRGSLVAMAKGPRRTLSRDTTPEAEAVQLEIYRRMPAWRKLEIMEEANRNTRELALAGLRMRHPDAGPEELFRRLMDLTLGEELAEEVYGPLGSGNET